MILSCRDRVVGIVVLIWAAGCGAKEPQAVPPQQSLALFTQGIESLEQAIGEAAASSGEDKQESQDDLRHRVGELEESFAEVSQNIAQKPDGEARIAGVSQSLAAVRRAAEAGDLVKLRESVGTLKTQASTLQ